MVMMGDEVTNLVQIAAVAVMDAMRHDVMKRMDGVMASNRVPGCPLSVQSGEAYEVFLQLKLKQNDSLYVDV